MQYYYNCCCGPSSKAIFTVVEYNKDFVIWGVFSFLKNNFTLAEISPVHSGVFADMDLENHYIYQYILKKQLS